MTFPKGTYNLLHTIKWEPLPEIEVYLSVLEIIETLGKQF